jgi:EH domain-containing protein 1
MHGATERRTPGNALAVSADKPFRGLSQFGTAFLSKLECAQCPAAILENITFIDTPGVLSGEKQRLGRSYDFPGVIDWFAEKSDLILLLFDAHKLDISDEFKDVITHMKRHDEKIRVILNKADTVDTQSLMRVYGAMMWSLGKVKQTPEVTRVFISSFWDKPFANTENQALFEQEREDLFKELRELPRYALEGRVLSQRICSVPNDVF